MALNGSPDLELVGRSWQVAAISGCEDKTVLHLLQVTDEDGRGVETR